MKSVRLLIPKIFFGAVTIFCVVHVNVCEAQTNSVQFKTVLVTNWVKPGIVMRVVDGKLYNTFYSKLWGDPITLMPIRKTIADNGHFIRYELVARFIKNDSISADVDAVTWWPETYTDTPQDEDRETIKSVIIYHFPNPEKLVSGQQMTSVDTVGNYFPNPSKIGTGQKISFRCMRVENYISNGISYEAYDCGTQYTNLIPVVTKEKIKIEPTNSISDK